MNEEGDPSAFSCSNFKDNAGLSGTKTNTVDLEVRPLHFPVKQWFDCNTRIRARQVSEIFLERQSLISFVEMDGEYIVSAGKDHEINVWDAVGGHHIRKLLGHDGPVTGLYLFSSKKACFSQRVIVSSSEDGSIRKWSLQDGEKIGVFWTGNVITCMGVMNNHDGDSLAVTGNSKGLIEVRHLTTGELYSTVLSHMDPIDVLVIDGNFACSAVFDDRSSLKVWQIKSGQITCIHNIDSEFCSVAMWGNKILLGALDGQKVQVVDFETNKEELINLGNRGCKVEHIRVWNNWVFSCSSSSTCVVLHVHRMDDYQHFGTFFCNMKQTYTVAATECDSSLKIVLGGSALVVLGFDFIPIQEDANTITKRLTHQETSSMDQKKKKGHYTMNKFLADEKDIELTNSDESSSSSEEKLNEKPYERDFLKSNSVIYSEVLEVKTNNYRTKFAEFWDDTLESSEPPVKQDINLLNPAPLFSEQRIFDRVSQCSEEPRMVIKRLEKILDENNDLGKIKEKEETIEIQERPKTCTEFIDEIMKKHYDRSDEDFHAEIRADSHQIKESKNDNVHTKIQKRPNENKQVKTLLNENNSVNQKFKDLKISEIETDKKKKSEKRKSFFNKCKSRSNKNITEKSGHKRCEIM